MRLFLLLLACSDKDPSEDTAEPVVDSGEAPVFDCVIDRFSPMTVPVDEDTTVRVELSCADAYPSEVGLALEDGEWTAASVGDGVYEVTLQSGVPGRQVPGFSLDGGPVSEGTARLHTYDDGLLAEREPAGWLDSSELQMHLWEPGPKGFVGVSKGARLVRVGGGGAEQQALDWTPPCDVTAERGLCLFSASRSGFVGATGGEVFWADLDVGTGSKSLESAKIGAVLDVVMGESAPIVAGLDGEGGLRLFDVHQAKVSPLTKIDGKALRDGTTDLRLFTDVAVVQSCAEAGLVLTDHDLEAGSTKGTADGGLLDCYPTHWSVAAVDVDGDGDSDQVHSFSYDDGDRVLVRLNLGGGAYGQALPLSGGSGLRYHRWVWRDAHGRVVLTGTDGQGRVSTFPFAVSKEGVEASTPTARGVLPPGLDLVRSDLGRVDRRGELPGDPDLPWVLGEGYLVGGQLAENGDGQALWPVAGGPDRVITRVRRSHEAEDLRWVDGEELGGGDEVVGDPSAHFCDLVGSEPLYVSHATATLKGALVTLNKPGAVPIGDVMDDRVWLYATGDEGAWLGLAPLDDLGSPAWTLELEAGTAAPAHRGQAASPAAVLPLGSGLGSPLGNYEGVVRTAIVVLPGGEGACGFETVAIPGLDEPDAGSALVLSGSDDPGCEGLAVPLARGDVLGDGGEVVLLSDGTALRVTDEGLESWALRPGLYDRIEAADVNGDLLVDLLFCEADRGDAPCTLWTSAGDGDALAEEDAPGWTRLSRPPSSIFPVSWAAVLD